MPGSQASPPRPRVGLAWVDPTAESVARIEEMSFDSIWVGGHVAADHEIPEAMAALARLSAMSARVRIGTSVLLLPLYPPAIVAKQVADIDRATGGRVTLGVGVGGEFPREFEACGVPVGERGERADELIGLLRRLWTAKPVTHRGRHYSFENVRIHPAPVQGVRLPIVVAGRKAPAMRRAAVLGDGWMPYLYSPERYRASVEAIKEIADRHDRKLDERFEWFAWVFVNVGHDGARTRSELIESLRGTGFSRLPASAMEGITVAGTPDEVVARLMEYLDAGASHLILAPTPSGGRERIAKLLNDEVIPRLTVATGGREYQRTSQNAVRSVARGVVSLDIDGTLEIGDPAGPIPVAFARALRTRGLVVGTCSDRTVGDQKGLWAEHGFELDFAVTKSGLERVRRQHRAGFYVHVGDTVIDQRCARDAGFGFWWAWDVPLGDRSWPGGAGE